MNIGEEWNAIPQTNRGIIIIEPLTVLLYSTYNNNATHSDKLHRQKMEVEHIAVIKQAIAKAEDPNVIEVLNGYLKAITQGLPSHY